MLSRSRSTPNPQDAPRARRPLALVLAFLGVIGLFVGLLVALRSVSRYRAYVSENLAYAQQALIQAQTPAAELAQLRQSLAQIEGLSTAISAMDSLVSTRYIDWPGVVEALADYYPGELALQRVTQDGIQLQLTGCAPDDTTVVAYAQRLQNSQRFTQVVVQSINLVNQPCTARSIVPTSVAISVTPTARLTLLPTATFADAYEPDDVETPLIFLNQPQTHTFCPNFDTDRVRLLVKAGRQYRIVTSDLAPGVDTRVVVHLEGEIYTNDDRQPGDLSSEVTFLSVRNYDVEALIEISNRGEYGPSHAYTLTALELMPTPTATTGASAVPSATVAPTSAPTVPTATFTTVPTPAATYTPSPSATITQAPSITPTPTFDLRDAQEPDDHAPRDIVVGQTYSHSFYPDADIDRARFTTEVGHQYRIYTSNLAMDVDTQLSVQVGGVIYANDNRSPEDLSSEVLVEGNGDQALILVLNRGRYGPAQWYKLTVEDLTPAPAATPEATAYPASAQGASQPGYYAVSFRTLAKAGQGSVASRGPGLASQARAKATPTPEFADPNMPGSVEFVILLTVEAPKP